jgi:hypothetical protein
MKNILELINPKVFKKTLCVEFNKNDGKYKVMEKIGEFSSCLKSGLRYHEARSLVLDINSKSNGKYFVRLMGIDIG